jgi:ankyrin repeat protein
LPDAAEAEDKAHWAASNGDVQALGEEISEKKEVVNNRDENGWQPIHEAAAGGHKQAVELLVNNGADVNTRTLGGRGGTPLHIAKKRFGPAHPVVQYLSNLGALDVSPDRSEL